MSGHISSAPSKYALCMHPTHSNASVEYSFLLFYTESVNTRIYNKLERYFKISKHHLIS